MKITLELPRESAKKLLTIHKEDFSEFNEYIDPFVLLDLSSEKIEHKRELIKSFLSGKENIMEPKNPKAKKILVVGDWIVDEFWVTGIHRSPTASRTGRSHYRVLQLQDCTIQSPGGAGRTASILYDIKHGSNPAFQIISIGIWDKEDTNIIRNMLDPNLNKGKNHHRIKRESIKLKDKGITLINIVNSLVEKNTEIVKKEACATTRAIRIYQHTGTKVDLINRVDWEVQSPDTGWISEEGMQKEDKKKISKLKEAVVEDITSRIPDKIDAVVIKDMCKGVVSEEIILQLCKKFQDKKNIEWYISSKAWNPTWLKELKDVNVNLILIPQVAAQSAIMNDVLNRWITLSEHASNGAFEKMDELCNRFSLKPTIVVLPEGSSIISRYNDKNDAKGLMQLEKDPYPFEIETPMASVFFAALIAIMLDGKENNTEKILKKAFAFTQTWMYKEAQRIVNYDSWDPTKEECVEHLDLNNLDKLDPKNLFFEKTKRIVNDRWTPITWEDEKKKWTMAFDSKNCGVITEKKDGKVYKKFELWRAMTDVKGYISCIESKRREIRRLNKELEAFKTKKTSYHKSCMLIASPGSGKTFLVKCLAQSVGLRYLSFNITQMISKEDILECFDTVVTTQAQNKGEEIIVFIDEINALIENQHIYDIFLSPLEEGVYVRAEKYFTIEPCFWIFAGTENPVMKDKDRDKSIKASDFVSRLSCGIFDLQIKTENAVEAEQARVEKVYLGISLLKSIFPDVRKVSENVLKAFHILNPSLEVRDVKNFVKAFKNIQYGEVRCKNVAVDWLKAHAFTHMDVTMWEKAPEGEPVEIVTL